MSSRMRVHGSSGGSRQRRSGSSLPTSDRREIRRAQGLAALKAAEELRPEVVILDIGMPHLDGYATVERLAVQPWASDTVFIAFLGRARLQARRASSEVLCDGV
jgi:CheY-like chemotaxis protein